MGRYDGRTAIVTGGSSGIGYEIARRLADGGASLVLVATDSGKLEDAARSLARPGKTPLAVARDLSLPGGAEHLREILVSRGLPCDILVNNAGFGMRGLFAGADPAKALKMIDLNVRALVELTRAFLPGMIERRWGRVLNVASTAGFQAIPVESVYAASKSFVILFTEGLALELEGTGVTATCLCPGATDTPFFKRGDIPASKALTRAMMDAGSVAREGLDGMDAGRPLIVAGARNRALMAFERFLPRRLVSRLARRVVE